MDARGASASDVHRCRPSWKPNTDGREADTGVCGCPVPEPLPLAGGEGDVRAGADADVGVGEGDPPEATLVLPITPENVANWGAVGLLKGEPVARPRMRWTMNGGTVCEPPEEPRRWCVARVGEDGPEEIPGSGGCGGRCDPLRRCADARRDSGFPETEECVEWRK